MTNLQLSQHSGDCPAADVDIEEYLDLEDYDRQKQTRCFVCRAECLDRTYWVWQYLDNTGTLMHVVVTQMLDRERDDMYIIGNGEFGREFSNKEALVAELLNVGV